MISEHAVQPACERMRQMRRGVKIAEHGWLFCRDGFGQGMTVLAARCVGYRGKVNMTKRDMLHQTIGRIREMEGAIELLSKALMGAEALRNNAYNALSATRLKFHAAQQEAANLKYLIAQAKKSKSK